MISQDGKNLKYYESTSQWVQSFDLRSIKCLIVCRGPVRKEAMDVFENIGISEYGILLSEKDSVIYPNTLAPELRSFKYKKKYSSCSRLHGSRPGRKNPPHQRNY